MKHIRYLLQLCFLTLLCPWTMANGHYVFTPIDGNDGLSGNKVRNITQLPDGRMVFTTEGLLNIYDGSRFTYLHYTEENRCPLSGYTGFHHEYVGNDGYMWLKNSHLLMAIDINQERFVDKPQALLAAWGVDVPLKDFFMDREKNLWLITDHDELLYLRGSKKEKTLFCQRISQTDGTPDPVYDLAVWEGKLYLFYRSGMLVCYDIPSQKELYRQQSLSPMQREKYGSTSFVMQNGKTFFQLRNGNGGGTLVYFDIERKNWQTILQTDYWLNYLSIDKEGNIWVSCQQGLWRINAGLTEKEYISTLKLVDGRTIHTEVSTLYNDNQGGLWLGTLNRGILYYHPDRFRFRNIGQPLFPLQEEKTINVTCFAEKSEKEVWVGTLQGVFLYHKDTGKLEATEGVLSQISCNALFADSHQRIWIGTMGRGLYSLDANGQLRHYPLPCPTIYSIMEKGDGQLYLSTEGHGFGTFHPSTGIYEEEIPVERIHHSVYQLVCLNRDTLAGINHAGYFLYDRNTRELQQHPSFHRYNTLFADSRQRIWLGSQDGLQVLDIRHGNKLSLHKEDGMVNNYIQSITEAKDGSIWVSTSNGLTRLTDKEPSDGAFSFANFNRFDGVISNEFWERAVYTDSAGNMFWGGTDGFNILETKNFATSQQTILPLFVNFELFKKKIESNVSYDNNVILKQPITLTKEIVLNHDQNFFTLEFSALNYINPTQTYYRYLLSGIDDKEQEMQSEDGRGRVSYTNLPPGNYRFKVRAANNSKEWTDQYAEINMIVKAPFWKTPFAYTLYILLATGIVAFSLLWYLQRKRRKLIREQKEKLDEMKSTFLRNMNEEMSTPIAQIISPLDLILKQTDEGRLKSQLKEIQNNAKDLQELVNQLSEEVLSSLPPAENELNMEVLLANMRQLLNEQKERKENPSEDKNETSGSDSLLSAADEKFIQRALEFVEQNLDNSDYTVEMLSKDMGMERTGLYRKLVSIIGKSPTYFIRSVRLKRAARLLEEGYTVAEVSDRVGFGTASYLSKCFQEEFGMKPSQYVASLKPSVNREKS